MATTTKARPEGRLNLLTARQVQHAREGDKNPDTGLPQGSDRSDGGGLLLRLRPGSASWVFRYTAASGARREMGLGPAHRGSVADAGASLTAARALAHEARELLRAGQDPIEVRTRRKAEQAAALAATKAAATVERWTLARCARDYHERVIEPRRSPKHAAQWIASLENHVPRSLWHKPAAEVEAPELLEALRAIQPHERARNLSSLGETVARVRQRLEAVFEDAIFFKRCTANPAAAIRRKLREDGPQRTNGAFRALPFAEAPALLQRIRQAEGTAARALELAILTATRTGEVLGAQWAEFDLDAARWTIPAQRTKAREAHDVFLSPDAVALLRALPDTGGGWLFPSPMGKPDAPTRPLSNMAMLVLLERLGVRDATTVHGLARATFSTWANERGIARPDVIEAALGHNEKDRVRAAYNRARFDDERRALMAAWAEFLARPAAAVVELRAA